MNVASLAILIFGALIAPLIPKAYITASQELYAARILVSASREPCPTLTKSRICQWQIQAKSNGIWQQCHGTLPPSGAEHLASHRYFKIVPKCQFGPGIPLLLPPQVVYR